MPTRTSEGLRCVGCDHVLRSSTERLQSLCESCINRVKSAWRQGKPATKPGLPKAPFSSIKWGRGLAIDLDSIYHRQGLANAPGWLTDTDIPAVCLAAFIKAGLVTDDNDVLVITDHGRECHAWLQSKGWL